MERAGQRWRVDWKRVSRVTINQQDKKATGPFDLSRHPSIVDGARRGSDSKWFLWAETPQRVCVVCVGVHVGVC